MHANPRLMDVYELPASSRAGLLRPVLARAARRIELWRRRARDRAELAQMSSLELRDIRYSRAEARYDASKPFWRE